MEHHHAFCATCRAPLCALCAASAAHREHYLLSRPAPAPCGGCADAASSLALQAAGLPEAFSTAVTAALARLQVLLLACAPSGAAARLSRCCDVAGALPLDLALGLLQEGQGGGGGGGGPPADPPSLPATLRAVQRCPLLHCTRASGSSALVGLHHPRAHEVAALAAAHAAGLPQPLAGRAARALARCGLLPQALGALAAGAPQWSPQACSPCPSAAAATPSPLALLPPPRLPAHPAGGAAQASPPPPFQFLSAATAAAAPAAAAPLALGTPQELRAWVRGVLEALAAPPACAPGELKGVCAIVATLAAPAPRAAGSPSSGARLARLDLACSLGGLRCAPAVSVSLQALREHCVAARRREELESSHAAQQALAGAPSAGAAAASARAGGGGEAAEQGGAFSEPSTLTLLHALLPLLLHPGLLKCVHEHSAALAPLAAEAGLHAVNTLSLGAVAEEGLELQGEAQAQQQLWLQCRAACEEEAARRGSGGSGSASSSSSSSASSSSSSASSGSGGGGSSSAAAVSAQQLLHLSLHWLRQCSGAAPASCPPRLLAAMHSAWLCSQLSGLAPPVAQAEGAAAGRKRALEAPQQAGGAAPAPYPLAAPPWYLECKGCRAECAGHFITDCPAWMADAH